MGGISLWTAVYGPRYQTEPKQVGNSWDFVEVISGVDCSIIYIRKHGMSVKAHPVEV